MNNRISVVGVEGSGKTYFISNTFKMKEYEKVYEPNFEINKILKTDIKLMDFKDKQKLIHDWMLNRDTKMNIKKKYIMERDFIGSVYVFKLEDNLFYKQIINNYINNYKYALPNIVIFFDTPAEICLERIKQRKRKYEEKITLEDIKAKIKLHNELLKIYEDLNIKIFRYTDDNDYNKLIKFIKSYNYSLHKSIIKLIYKPKVIVIEGNIASGKSSILKYYKDNKYTVIDEPFDKMKLDYNKDFLKGYYQDQTNRYINTENISTQSLNFQTLVYQYKYYMFNKIYNKEHKDNIIFIERSVLSGWDVFCKSNIMTEQELSMVELIYNNTSTKRLCYNAKEVLYINVKPDVCMLRAHERDKDTESIGLDLLRFIDTNYNIMLNKIKKSGIKVKKFNNDLTLDELIIKINKHLNIKLNTIKTSIPSNISNISQ
jgi:dephospho-CoA kinase